MIGILWSLAAAGALAREVAPEMVLVQEGQPKALIVVGVEASPQAQEAAQELQTFLRRITGAELPVVPSPTDLSSPRILVGQSAARTEAARMGLEIPSGQTPQFDEEGYVVAAGNNVLILAGNETEPYQGTFFAVYDFLETLGCRWFFPGDFGEVIPSMPTIAVKPFRRVERPEFRVRDTWYSGHLAVTPEQAEQFRLWKRRNRMTRPDFWAAPESRFLQNPVDDSTYRLLPKEKYWEAHPEFYALNPGGSRNERFLCMSHPGALQAAADTIIEYFQQHPDHYAYAFSPPDAPVLCHCPDCIRAMHGGYGGEGYGEVSDAYFRFVFQLADRVRQRFPDRWVTTMAYYNRCRPPEGIEGKRPNLLIQLASIQQCSLHSYADRNCWSRQMFGSMLRRWAELTAGQGFYEYDPHDWSHLQRPAWGSQRIAEDLWLLKQVGGWGYSNEGQMAWLSTGLNYYVRAKLAWDLKQDPAALEKDFFRRFFGPSAEPMRRYYTAVEKALQGTSIHALSGAPDDLFAILPRPFLDQCLGWLEEAQRLAVAEPFWSRVAAFRGHFDRIDAAEKARAAMARGDFQEAIHCGEAMVKAVSRVNDSMLLQEAGPWGGSLSGAAFIERAQRLLPWTNGTQGRLVAMLPAVAWFRTDPASEGVVQRWYRPQVSSQGWQQLRMTSAWHNQGIVTREGRRYRGLAWYRVKLQLPRLPAGSVRLLFPELQASEVGVWCNGQFAGLAEDSGEGLWTVGLTSLLRPGENLLAFRVQGEGGLTLPPFLFTPLAPLSFLEGATEIPVLPAQWLFQTDPEGRGEEEGWQQPDFADQDWRSLSVTRFWDDQIGPYYGTAWYRVHFLLPAEVEGKSLVLRFGAADEEAWVYLNGERIGEHTTASTGQTIHQIWDKPFLIPVRNARPGAENVLAVRVRNAVAAGGLFKPVQLFALP